jgi:hypothetical protein
LSFLNPVEDAATSTVLAALALSKFLINIQRVTVGKLISNGPDALATATFIPPETNGFADTWYALTSPNPEIPGL